MTSEPAPLSEVPPTGLPPPPRHRSTGLLVAEDWLLAAWVAVASPILFRQQGGGGPFDSGAPLLGLLRLLAVAGALVCLTARRPAQESTDRRSSLVLGGAIGPLVGALLLVTISGFTGLDLGSGVGVVLVIVALVAMIVVHVAVPPLSIPIRRALITPFVLVSGGLFWTFIAAISGEPGSATPAAVLSNPGEGLGLGAFLLAFSAVFYTMLIYAPRQVAEREGGLVTWALRYALFVAGVVAGLAWPRLFGL
jgi:hypothetical protein